MREAGKTVEEVNKASRNVAKFVGSCIIDAIKHDSPAPDPNRVKVVRKKRTKKTMDIEVTL